MCKQDNSRPIPDPGILEKLKQIDPAVNDIVAAGERLQTVIEDQYPGAIRKDEIIQNVDSVLAGIYSKVSERVCEWAKANQIAPKYRKEIEVQDLTKDTPADQANAANVGLGEAMLRVSRQGLLAGVTEYNKAYSIISTVLGLLIECREHDLHTLLAVAFPEYYSEEHSRALESAIAPGQVLYKKLSENILGIVHYTIEARK